MQAQFRHSSNSLQRCRATQAPPNVRELAESNLKDAQSAHSALQKQHDEVKATVASLEQQLAKANDDHNATQQSRSLAERSTSWTLRLLMRPCKSSMTKSRQRFKHWSSRSPRRERRPHPSAVALARRNQPQRAKTAHAALQKQHDEIKATVAALQSKVRYLESTIAAQRSSTDTTAWPLTRNCRPSSRRSTHLK